MKWFPWWRIHFSWAAHSHKNGKKWKASWKGAKVSTGFFHGQANELTVRPLSHWLAVTRVWLCPGFLKPPKGCELGRWRNAQYVQNQASVPSRYVCPSPCPKQGGVCVEQLSRKLLWTSILLGLTLPGRLGLLAPTHCDSKVGYAWGLDIQCFAKK